MHPTRVIKSHELIFVKQGELDMFEEGEHFHLEAGDTLHLWPQRRHGSTRPMLLGLKFYWIHFVLEEQDEARTADEFAPMLKVPQTVSIAQPERLERLFRTFLEDQETGALTSDSANLLTMLMLVEIAQSLKEKAASPNDLNVLATWAHTYIRINYGSSLTTSSIAEALGYNADYLGRIYRQIYGFTLTEAIHRRRISVACDYLMDSNLTVEQIAQKCGFTDPDYFRRVFKRYQRISPGAYREEFSHFHVNTH
jgi:YesN/AraC family two-component response regulator